MGQFAFWKLHGAGNDFVIADNRTGQLSAVLGAANGGEQADCLSLLAARVCDRHFGVGADGFMAAEQSEIADIRMVYYNSDGSLGSMCGNGIRCFSKFVRDQSFLKIDPFTVETGDGVKSVRFLSMTEQVSVVKVEMGRPGPSRQLELSWGGRSFPAVHMHMGVPHTIIFATESGTSREKLDELAVEFGPQLEHDSAFPEGTNVNFVAVKDSRRLLVSTWERGAGKTLACGTGACASAAAAREILGLESDMYAEMPGGTVVISVEDSGDILMQGEARLICRGEFVI